MGAESSNLRRNGAEAEIWKRANSDQTVAAKARLEATARVAATNIVRQDGEDNGEEVVTGYRLRLRRLAYSSVLNVKSRDEAHRLLTTIFSQALVNNPRLKLGGILYYDEETSSLVQVLEGPSFAVRSLFYQRISRDTRHTAVRVLWDVEVASRRYEGFGMKVCDEDPSSAAEQDASVAEQLQQQQQQQEEPTGTPPAVSGGEPLFRLTYTSVLTATYRSVANRLLMDIVRKAVVNNPKLSIGGALFFNPSTFRVVQVLEGPLRAVRMLYEKISNDLRHTDCIILSAIQTTVRTYKEWGMMQGEIEDWSELMPGGDWTGPVMSATDDLAAAHLAAGGEGGGSDGVGDQSRLNDVAPLGEQAERAAAAVSPESSAGGGGGVTSTSSTSGSFSSKPKRSLFKGVLRGGGGGGGGTQTETRAETEALGAPPKALPQAQLVVGPFGPVVRWSSEVSSFPERTPEKSRVNRAYSHKSADDGCTQQ